MFFHVIVEPRSPNERLSGALCAFNLTQEKLQAAFLAPYEEGRPITWRGRTLAGGDLQTINVARSAAEVSEPAHGSKSRAHQQFRELEDVTNDWITGGPGSATTTSALDAARGSVERITTLCERFGLVARQLARRHAKGQDRGTHLIKDEYDVQDLFHALLLIDFDDVRPESSNPNFLGKSSRVDFFLPLEGIAIEIKKTRPTLTDSEIGDELAEDVTRYGDQNANGGATTLVIFVYDPDRHLKNPRGLERDLARSSERLRVTCVVTS